MKKAANLIIEASFLIEIIEEFGIGFTTPKVEISDFKVAPNWEG
jgi:hypothetical protein